MKEILMKKPKSLVKAKILEKKKKTQKVRTLKKRLINPKKKSHAKNSLKKLLIEENSLL